MFSETHSDSQRADRILASIRREEARPGRGLLKIFFGMAPGVGKTCAMLEAAIQAADKGVQVIIGVAESHGREDTMRLIGRLPRLPMKKMVYRGVEMEEFDLEEALRVKPQLILVDELATLQPPPYRKPCRIPYWRRRIASSWWTLLRISCGRAFGRGKCTALPRLPPLWIIFSRSPI